MEMRSVPVNIVLEGFMGTGKTTLGRALAGLLHYAFVDTDDAVRERAGKSIRDMLADGELPLVRDWEKKTCRELAELTQTVIATGGGVFTNEENAAALKKSGFVVCLERDFDVVYPLISSDPVRVLAYGKPYQELKALLDSRTPIYRRHADLIVSSDGDPAETAAAIAEAYRKFCAEIPASC